MLTGRFIDSREGLGTMMLQHSGYAKRYPLDMRASLWAVRVTDRQDRDGQYGHWEYDEGSVGDVIGACHWPSSGGLGATGVTGGRDTGAWSWVWPVVTQAPTYQASVISLPTRLISDGNRLPMI